MCVCCLCLCVLRRDIVYIEQTWNNRTILLPHRCCSIVRMEVVCSSNSLDLILFSIKFCICNNKSEKFSKRRTQSSTSSLILKVQKGLFEGRRGLRGSNLQSLKELFPFLYRDVVVCKKEKEYSLMPVKRDWRWLSYQCVNLFFYAWEH